jgi:hypothetical protein
MACLIPVKLFHCPKDQIGAAMPALKPTSFTGEITYLGRIRDRSVTMRSEDLQRIDVRFAGVEGEDHVGLTRPSCSRVKAQHPRGTEIRNVRQFSILSHEELDQIAAEMGVLSFDPAWVGATMVIKDIPDFSHIPPSSRLQAEAGTTLIIDMQNRPCIYPGEVIEEDAPGHGKSFLKAARNRRGVTASVEREGPLKIGDKLTLHIPDQRPWDYFEEARS